MVGCGLVIGRIEDWSFGDAVYFTFATGLTIKYDLTPKHGFADILALVIGFSGIVMTGIICSGQRTGAQPRRSRSGAVKIRNFCEDFCGNLTFRNTNIPAVTRPKQSRLKS